ncbi:hypothetical protein F4777DRAFT_559022 [Nemania sp. FL0916]|nr:hypothetical protein F4777DRAFT_559022 [Nemania sp. FL0916]
MHGKYICLDHDLWDGKIANITLSWQEKAQKKLRKHAKDQDVDALVLKAASEHFIYRLAYKMRSQKAVIRNAFHIAVIPNTDHNADQTPDKLLMLGQIITSSCGFKTHQIRIYLDADKAASTRYDELEVTGEMALRPLGVPRIATLDLAHSWGVGAQSWSGPTTGRYQIPSNSTRASRSYTIDYNNITSRRSSDYTVMSPRDLSHRMNPEAAEFHPRTAIDQTYAAQTGLSSEAGHRMGAPFAQQNYCSLCAGQNAGYTGVEGCYGLQFDAAASMPSSQGNVNLLWDPYTWSWRSYIYNPHPEGLQLFSGFGSYLLESPYILGY